MKCEELKRIIGGKDDCYKHSNIGKERGRKVRFVKNGDDAVNFCRVGYDNCIITTKDEKKCDYIFMDCSNGNIFFTELKGNNNDGFDQITSSIKRVRKTETIEKSAIFGVIVTNSMPSTANSKYRKESEKFIEKWGRKLIRKSSEAYIDIDRL